MNRVAGIFLLTLGLASLAFVRFLFPASVGAPVAYANTAAAVLELLLGVGVLKGKRAPWAFAVSLEGTMLLVNVLALAPMVREGLIASVVIAGARGVAFVLLLLAKN